MKKGEENDSPLPMRFYLILMDYFLALECVRLTFTVIV